MRSLNILIAEDDAQNQAVMKLILGRQGHNIKSAWNGMEALEAVKSGDFDLVFMDVHMPGIDGLETTRQIRVWENKKKHTPIVILTGSVPEQTSNEYKRAGADTFLQKPFDLHRINMVVNIIVSELETENQKQPQDYSDESFEEQPLLDVQDALSRFSGDEQTYKEYLKDFLTSLPNRSQQMEICLKNKDWDALANRAHNLKGVAANFGAKQLAVLSSRLDEHSNNQDLLACQKIYTEIDKNISGLCEYAINVIFTPPGQENNLA